MGEIRIMMSYNLSNEEYKEYIRESLRNEFQRKNYDEETYVSPSFKKMNKERVDEIHSKGLITPEEVVSEWESIGLCTPGDSGFNERCNNFKNCHDCLVDYSNKKEEYMSFSKIREEMTGIKNEFVEDIKKLVKEK